MRIRLKKRENLWALTLALPFVAGFITFYIIPFFISVYQCFFRSNGTEIEFQGISNFVRLFTNEAFLLAAKNTLTFDMLCIPLIMVISFFIAYLLSKKLVGSNLFRSTVVVPLVLPVSSLIIVWQLFFTDAGYVNSFLTWLNIDPVEFMKTDAFFPVLCALYIWKNVGYNVILFAAGLAAIPDEYREAAAIDGAGSWQLFRKITFPCLMPTTIIVLIMSIINSFKVFREAYLLAGSYPPLSTYMLQHYMNNNFYKLNYQNLSTAAFIVFTIILVVVYSIYRIERRISRDF